MKIRLTALLLGILPLAHGEEIMIDPAIDSVAMFKNGLTVVHASFDVSKPGDFVWVDPPKAVHGAFFVESGPGMVIRSTQRAMKPAGAPPQTGNLQLDLAGAVVRVSLQNGTNQRAEEVKGTVWTAPLPERSSWVTSYATTDGQRFGYRGGSTPSRADLMANGKWLILQLGGQRRYLATDQIVKVQVDQEAVDRPKLPQPVLVFSAAQAGQVQLTYLTKGMAWAPDYQIDLLDGDRMRIKQTAVVRNELMNLKKTKLELISGYPNIKFGHVNSLLGGDATLAAFFQQVSQQGGGGRGLATQQIVFNNIASNGYPAAASLPNPEVGAAAEDLHYESIGAHELLEGDSLSLEVARAETSCERIVEWRVPDYRDSNGRLRRNQAKDEENEPWDAVQFANPLKFPMTTAAASVLEGGRFRGQSIATWTAPGQKASIRINKALTVRGEHSEVEEEGKRAIVWIAGDDFQRTVVSGRLKVTNTRADAVKMVIRTDFSGDLISADGKPVKTLRADGARSVNPHRQLEWTLDLEGGKSQVLTYRYSLLVNR